MKTIIPALLLLCSSTYLLGQNTDGSTAKGNGKISGVVIDSANQKVVEFATVALMEGNSNNPIDGAVCDEKGKFQIKQIAPGQYRVVISFIGYETKTISVTLSEKREDVQLGTVQLSSTAAILSEVTVQGAKAMIEERVDRTIYNAENDLTAKGGDATDVLQRVPMLSVDLDGNVSLRGNSNIQVLINNKPSTIMASNIGDALKQIPADQIKSVEVITSPSAKYDAEGSAGIINIITKKNTLEGLTLNINSGVGFRGSNLGLNGNFRKGKMGFSLGGWGRANYNINGKFRNEQYTRGGLNDPFTLNLQGAKTRNSGIFGNYTLGWDYDINPKNYVIASVRFGVRNGRRYQDDLFNMRYDENNDLIFESLADVSNRDNANNVDASLTYTHLYTKPQHELSIQGQYSRNNQTSNFLNLARFGPSALQDFKNINDSYNQEMTIQVDYQRPINTNQMLEFGAKDIMRKVSSEFASFRSIDGEFIQSNDATQNNNLNYDQNVMAAYLSYTISAINGYSFKAGTRYEYTTINAYSQTEDNIEIPSYGVLVPSVNASKKLKNGNTIKASYNRRIQRPSIRFLNPNIQFQNELNYTVGNPRLDPEFTNNYELGYSTFIKGTSLNFTAFVRNTNDAIQSIRDNDPDQPNVIRTSYDNIGLENAYGGSVFANINIGKLTLNTGGDLYYAVLDNKINDEIFGATNEGWVVNGRMFGSYRLNKGWAIQGFGFMRARQVQLQGTQGAFRMYSAGFQKEFNEKRGSIGLALENFLQSSLVIRNETVTPLIQQKGVNTLNNTSFRVNFSYRIGKMSVDQRPRRTRRSINNDDLKDGGGGDGGMDGGQGGQGQPQQRSGGFTPIAPRSQTPATNDKMASVDSAAVVNPEGTWSYTIESPQGGAGNLTITKEGEKYSGTITNNRFNRETPLSSVILTGNQLTFSYELSMGANSMVVNVASTIIGDELNGTMVLGQFGSFPINAKRSQ